MINNDLLTQKVIDNATLGKLVENDSFLNDLKFKKIECDLFDLPDNWFWTTMEEIIEYKNGFAYNTSMMSPKQKGIPVIKSANIGSKKVIIDSKTDFVENPTDKMLNSSINKDDILMVLSSQSANVEPLGVSAIYKNEEIALLNQRVLKIRCKDGINPDYLLYVINSSWFHKKLSNKAAGLAQANLKLSHVLTMEVPLPAKEIQDKIVKKIEEIVDLIDKKQKNDVQIKKYKEILKNKFLEFEFTNPSIKFQELVINDVVDKIQYGYTASALEKGNIKMLRITDIQNNSVNWERVPFCDIEDSKRDFYKLHDGDIVVARTGGTVGKNFLIQNIPEDSVFASYLIRLVPSSVNCKYLKYFMDSPLYWRQLQTSAKGLTSGYSGVNSKNLSMLKIPIPSSEEQHKIVEKIEQCFELIEQL